MLPTRYNPIFDLANAFWGDLSDFHDGKTVEGRRLLPQVDVVTKEDGWTFYVDLPGVKLQDVNIELESDQLVVSGERHVEETSEDKNYIFSERSYGKFQRRFALPDSVDRDSVSASMKEGVLEIHFGKIPEVKPRKIEIKEH